jgi:8-amino-7-oxononanoate synthase
LGPLLKFVDRTYVLHEERKLIYFGGIDYHRMSNNPLILQSLIDAADEYGLNCSGSRTTIGNHPIYIELEAAAANFFQTEAAAVFGSGYLSNIIFLQAASKYHDIFFLDEISHSSIVDAVKQSGNPMIYFRHMDADNLEKKMRNHLKPGNMPLITTDGVFAARGDIPPLSDYAQIAAKYDAKILTDDAHAMAVVGPTGKGSWEHAGIDRHIVYQTGTLSKGFGVYGGVIPENYDIIDKIQKGSNAFIGSTGLPLPVAAAAIKSIEYLQQNLQLIRGLQTCSLALKEKLGRLGFDLPLFPSPIISITFNDEKKNKMLHKILLENGIYPPFTNYPGAPPGGHFRFAISSVHEDSQIDLLYEAIKSSVN